jgi:hypothetical protein
MMINSRFPWRWAVPGSFALLLLLSAAFVAGQPARKIATAPQTAAQKFDPEGEFNVEGSVPRALSEVSTIQLLRDAKRSFQNSHSGLYTNRGVTYRFKTLSVTRASFTFTTVALDGISYSFKGRFLRGGVFAELDSDQWGKIILEGQLTKLKGGRKVAAANLKFSYFGGT